VEVEVEVAEVVEVGEVIEAVVVEVVLVLVLKEAAVVLHQHRFRHLILLRPGLHLVQH
jgi:hypothetical protein